MMILNKQGFLIQNQTKERLALDAGKLGGGQKFWDAMVRIIKNVDWEDGRISENSFPDRAYCVCNRERAQPQRLYQEHYLGLIEETMESTVQGVRCRSREDDEIEKPREQLVWKGTSLCITTIVSLRQIQAFTRQLKSH